ncbi:MAG: hypothetical protein ACYS6I_04330 [Planctomycetota bacterium]|jgi:chromosome segregation ATPase
MREKKRIHLAVVLACFTILAGCDHSAEERDEALAEAQQLRDELEQVRTALEEIQYEADKIRVDLNITSEELEDAQTERDQLKESSAIISEELQNTKSKLAAAMQTKGDLEYQIAGLTRQQNATIAIGQEDQSVIESLTSQLEEKDSTINELEQLNIELQAAIEELQNYIQQMEEQVEEEYQEEYVEQYEEEAYDQNDI